jgi:CRP-like cAMP-binding protein
LELEGNEVVFVFIKERASLGSSFFRARLGAGSSTSEPRKDQIVVSQGDPADSVFYIQRGKVKLTCLSRDGKKATVAILGAGDFFGEESLTVRQRHIATVTAMTDCRLERLEKAAVTRVLRDEPKFSELFMSYLLTRKIQTELDLVDQLLNPTDKRLARRLLFLADLGKAGAPGSILMKISQETLAEMIGTTQSRVSFFMNKFRSLGLIDYNGTLRIRSSLSKLVASD